MKAAVTRFIRSAKRMADTAMAQRISASIPGFAGLALVSLGAAFIYLPAGLIVAGALLLRVDSRL